MIKPSFVLVCLLFLSTYSFAQKASIKGEIVVNQSNSPAKRGPAFGRYAKGGSSTAKTEVKALPVLVWIEGSTNQNTAKAKTPPILDQKDLSFNPVLIAIRQGETVRILNSDPVYHNVFSLSKVKQFDVGRRPAGEYLDVTFEKAGTVDVFCDIHSSMNALIKVLPNTTLKWFVLPRTGQFDFSGLKAGAYTIKAFAPGYDTFEQKINLSESQTTTLPLITLQR